MQQILECKNASLDLLPNGMEINSALVGSRLLKGIFGGCRVIKGLDIC